MLGRGLGLGFGVGVGVGIGVGVGVRVRVGFRVRVRVRVRVRSAMCTAMRLFCMFPMLAWHSAPSSISSICCAICETGGSIGK